MNEYMHQIEINTVYMTHRDVGVAGVVFILMKRQVLDPAQPIREGDYITFDGDGQIRSFKVNRVEHSAAGTLLRTIDDWSYEYDDANLEALREAHERAKEMEALGYVLSVRDNHGHLSTTKEAA